jgi:hypothetical protein
MSYWFEETPPRELELKIQTSAIHALKEIRVQNTRRKFLIWLGALSSAAASITFVLFNLKYKSAHESDSLLISELFFSQKNLRPDDQTTYSEDIKLLADLDLIELLELLEEMEEEV